ncbi:hypothetical protein KGM48_01750 [Patescibacteria group bacterium]|nr:hypothetical protein [Patescibacteria group bacterium]
MEGLFAKKKAISVFAGVFFLTISIGGVYMAAMPMQDGIMHECPFMGVPALCHMSPLEHLTQWQTMFAATVQQALILFTALALIVALGWHFIRDLLLPERAKAFSPRYRKREPIVDPLRLALAKGIIHSKAF